MPEARNLSLGWATLGLDALGKSEDETLLSYLRAKPNANYRFMIPRRSSSYTVTRL
jgi:hypothetical protein